ncbi:MAG: glutathione metabolism protein [Proteobacteria bacterium]|nr:glutathione metabolism protein [Pseudomonadota bacterium]
MVITSLLAGFLGLWLLGQSVLVMLMRRQLRVAIGNGAGKQPLLERAMRAQANTAEYAPLLLILLGLAEMQTGAMLLLAMLAGIIAAGRVFHAIALLWTEPRDIKLGLNFRVAGMACTWTGLGILAGWALVVGLV